MQFKRKFASSEVLCNECRKATFDKSAYKYHHWTEEEKKKANEVRKETCFKKYGIEYVTQTSQMINAVHQTARNRTAKEREQSTQKRKSTNIKKYEVENPTQNNDIKKKIKETCLKKYGTSNAAASEKVKEKIKDTFNKKYSMNPLSTVEVRRKIQSTMEKRYGMQFISQNKDIAKNISDKLLQYGEAVFLEHCKENNLEPIDFSYKGYYNKGPIYYKCKCLKCNNEIEIAPHNNNFKEAKVFTDTNHLQSHANANVYLGLFYENELVQLESFGHPRFSKKYEWEIIRECSKKDTSVVGGKSKLFSYFIKHYDPKSIVSYCDAAKFTGDSYLKCGMTLLKWDSPGYVWSYGLKVLSRYQCQKHKLIKNNPELENYTESEIMHTLGYAKIYDCGQKIFVWTKNPT